ncbi:MAG TPA: choice-of-anchor Q domain-containing protein [Solirubrobacterales bacterium]
MTTTDDTGEGSFRDAITSTNASSDFDNKITFNSTLSGTITLSSPLPDITTRVKIIGPGRSQLTVDAGTAAGVLKFVGDGGLVSYVSDLSLSGGDAVITAVDAPNLVIDRTTISGGGDAGLDIEETPDDIDENYISLVTMSNSTVTGNAVGVLGHGDLTYFNATDTAVDDNDVGISLEGGGGGLGPGSISGNTEGGVQVADANFGVINAEVTDNHGTGGIRAVSVDGSPSDDGLPHTNVTSSTISGNTSDTAGGGISAEGLLHIYSSTVSGNSAPSGGGVDVPDSSYAYTYFSTFSGNTATGAGGALHLGDGAFAALVSSTISGNTAAPGGGGGVSAPATSAYILPYNTIVANSSGPDLVGDAAVAAYYSLIEDPGTVSIVGSENITGVDPALGPLANNGGSTETLKPAPSSRAVDAGYAPVFPDNDTVRDQRGILRPQDLPGVPNVPGGDGSDIGAVELTPSEGPPFTPPPASPVPSTTSTHKPKCKKKKHKRSAESAKKKCKKKRKRK